VGGWQHKASAVAPDRSAPWWLVRAVRHAMLQPHASQPTLTCRDQPLTSLQQLPLGSPELPRVGAGVSAVDALTGLVGLGRVEELPRARARVAAVLALASLKGLHCGVLGGGARREEEMGHRGGWGSGAGGWP
jgi:hypothetical protein